MTETTAPNIFEGFEEFKKTLPAHVQGERFRLLYLTFDIEKALFLIKKYDLPVEQAEVAAWSRALGMEGKYEPDAIRIMNGVCDKDIMKNNINTKIPVIIVQMKFKSADELMPMLIDGNKRLRRACLDGAKTVPAYHIPWSISKHIVSGMMK